jgi:hypothetical protein
MARVHALEFLGLRPWEFDRIESVHDFNAMVRHEIHRRQVTEDLFGYLRLAVLIAGQVTFSEHAPPMKPGTPTFEKLMGRAPVPFVPGMPPADPPPPDELSESAARAQAMITIAGLKKSKKERPRPAAAPRPPELTP